MATAGSSAGFAVYQPGGGVTVMSAVDECATPAPLFDPVTEHPPRDALEVYLELPMTVSLWAVAVAGCSPERKPKAHETRHQLDGWRRHALAIAINSFVKHAGYVKIGDHTPLPTSGNQPARRQRTIGRHDRARLELTTVTHDVAVVDPPEDVPVHRFHDHIYVGASAEALDGSGRWPVDVFGVEQASLYAHIAYIMALQHMTSGVFQWVTPPCVSDEWEIVGVDCDWYLERYRDIVCRGLGPVYEIIRPARLDPSGHPQRLSSL